MGCALTRIDRFPERLHVASAVALNLEAKRRAGAAATVDEAGNFRA